MVKVSVFYPNAEGKKSDMDMLRQQFARMCKVPAKKQGGNISVNQTNSYEVK